MSVHMILRLIQLKQELLIPEALRPEVEREVVLQRDYALDLDARGWLDLEAGDRGSPDHVYNLGAHSEAGESALEQLGLIPEIAVRSADDGAVLTEQGDGRELVRGLGGLLGGRIGGTGRGS